MGLGGVSSFGAKVCPDSLNILSSLNTVDLVGKDTQLVFARSLESFGSLSTSPTPETRVERANMSCWFPFRAK